MSSTLYGLTTDKGYAKQATGRYQRGTEVILLTDVYYCKPWPAGTTGILLSLSNAGFRGIEACFSVDHNGRTERIITNLDNIALRMR